MRLLSWNVNGLRAIMKKGFRDFVDAQRPDCVCLQETRARPDQVALDLAGYHVTWHPADRPGYSGTALLTRAPPLRVLRGLGRTYRDREGRVLAVEFARSYVVSVYAPNSKRDLSRLPDRLAWEAAFRRHVARLAAHKPVIFAGDMNVAHAAIDLARPKQNQRTHGFTRAERDAFSALLQAGFVDTFRALHPDQGEHYTWWRQFGGARERNIGWRIDYVCMSQALLGNLQSAFILPKVMGSDHCPVGIEFDL